MAILKPQQKAHAEGEGKEAIPLNHSAQTSIEWRETIQRLQGEATEAEQQLEAARQRRIAVDAGAILHGGPTSGLEKLVADESQAERRLQALGAAMTMATAQLRKAEAAEREAEAKRLAERRTALVAEIVSCAQRADRAWEQSAQELRQIESLLSQYRGAAGQTPFVALKYLVMRAVSRAGMYGFLEGPFHSPLQCQPLAEQLGKWLGREAPAPAKTA